MSVEIPESIQSAADQSGRTIKAFLIDDKHNYKAYFAVPRVLPSQILRDFLLKHFSHFTIRDFKDHCGCSLSEARAALEFIERLKREV